MQLRFEATKSTADTITASLSVHRADGWHICGIFSLLREEFDALAYMLHLGGIEVITSDAAEPVQAHSA